MSKQRRNPSMRWALLAGVLVALGAGIYHVQGPEPMCVIHGEWRPVGFADSGRLVVVLEPNAARPVDGPLRILDAGTGAEIARHLANEQVPLASAISSDGRFVAVEVQARHDEAENTAINSLFLLDTKINQIKEFKLDEDSFGTPSVQFSKDGSLLFRIQAKRQKGLRIWETVSGRLVHEHRTEKYQVGARFSPHGPVVVLDDIVVYEVGTGQGANDLTFWNHKERQRIGTIAGAGSFVGLSRDGTYCVSSLNGTSDGVGSPQWWVWDFKNTAIEKAVPLEKIIIRALDAKLSPDARWMATINWDDDGRFVEIRSLPTPGVVKKQHLKDITRMSFSPDSKLLTVSMEPPQAVKMFDVASLQEIWHKSGCSHDEQIFSADSSTVFLWSPEDNSVQAVESTTGKVHAQFALPPIKGQWARVSLAPLGGGRHVVVQAISNVAPLSPWLKWLKWINPQAHGPRHALVVIDVDSCRERFRLSDVCASWAWLSDDGRTLATVQPIEPSGHVIYCWDTEASKPLRWPLGVPAAVTAIAGGFAFWRRRRSNTAGEPADKTNNHRSTEGAQTN